MSTPAGGYPDWQDQQSWRGAMLVDQIVNVGGGGVQVLGPWNLINYASIRVDLEPINGSMRCTLETAFEPTFATSTVTKSWTLRGGQNLTVAVPVTENFVRIRVTGGILALNTIRVRTQPINTVTGTVKYVSRGSTTTLVGQVLAPAGVAALFFPRIEPGRAWVFFRPSAFPSTLDARVRLIDIDGVAFARSAQWVNPGAVVQQEILLPENVYDMAITNTGAANQTFDLTVITGLDTL